MKQHLRRMEDLKQDKEGQKIVNRTDRPDRQHEIPYEPDIPMLRLESVSEIDVFPPPFQLDLPDCGNRQHRHPRSILQADRRETCGFHFFENQLTKTDGVLVASLGVPRLKSCGYFSLRCQQSQDF